MPKNNESTDFSYEIVQQLGDLSNRNGFCKTVNLIRWGDSDNVMLDIRKWTPDGKMGKGISLNAEELDALKQIIQNIDL